MKNKNIYLNKLQLISLILSLVTFVFIILFPNLKLENLCWIFISLNLLGSMFFLNKWHKDGITWNRKADKNYSKNITRKSSDTCLFLIVVNTFIICIIYSLDLFVNNFSESIYALAIMLLTNIVINFLLYKITKKVNSLIKKMIPTK